MIGAMMSISTSHFKFYTDSEMHEPKEEYRIDFTGEGFVDFTLYFGSIYEKEKLRSVKDKIQMWPESRLQKWQPNRSVPEGLYIEPQIPNGYMYKCVQSGVTGETEPIWPLTDDVKNDNTVTWRCLGQKIKPEDVRMALKRSALKEAEGGAKLELGAEIKGGQSIPIYFRVINTDSTPRTDLLNPCICIKINDVIWTYLPSEYYVEE